MINRIFQCVDLIQKRTVSLVNKLSQYQGPILQVSTFSVVFVVFLYRLKTSTAASCFTSANDQNVVLKATLDCKCDGNTSSSNILPEIIEEKTDSSNILPEIIEEKTEFSVSKSDQIASPVVQDVNTEVRDIENLAFGVDMNEESQIKKFLHETFNRIKKNEELQIKKFLHETFNRINKFYYFGTRPIENDLTRLELRAPLGEHEPTLLRIGSLETSFRLSGIPKTRVIKWGNMVLNSFDELTPESSSMKTLIAFLMENVTMGTFNTTTITRRGNDFSSNVMYWKTYVEQHQHSLMVRQIMSIAHHVDPRVMLVVIANILNPNEAPINPPPLLNEAEINAVGNVVRAIYLPFHAVGDIPELVNVDGRFLVENDQIKSVSDGILIEFNLLRLTFAFLKQKHFWTRYVQNRFDIALRSTRTSNMATDLLEARINVSRIGFDALKAVASRTPFIKRAYPMINFTASCAQERFPLQVLLQVGQQHSDTVNFNLEQENIRNNQMFQRNLIVQNELQQRQVAFFRPIIRRQNANHLAEIHSRTFYSFRVMFQYDLDIFGKLAEFTSPKEK